MKKLVLSLFALALVFGLVLVLDANEANAMPTFKEVPAGMTNCSSCHTGAGIKKVPDHTGREGKACTTCHAAAKPAPAPAKAPAPAPAKAPAPAPAKAPTPAPAKAPAPAPIKITAVDFSLFKTSGKAETAVENGITYVSLKSIADLYKTAPAWDQKTKQVAIKVADFEFKGTANKKEAVVNGKAVTLDHALRTINNKLFVSADSFAKAIGVNANVASDRIELKPGKSAAIRIDLANSRKGLNTITARYTDDPTAAPAGRTPCAGCHNAAAYGQGINTAEGMTHEEILNGGFGNNCSACHDNRDRGSAIVPGGYGMADSVTVLDRGRGAFCMDCHNPRGGAPNPAAEKRSYPHYGPQAGVLLGFGGMQVDDFNYGTSPHAANPDSCISCHMPKDEYGYASHSFKVSDYPESACGSCHNGLTTVNRPALGDYDGNGKVEGIQNEVKGLLSKLTAAINYSIDPNGGSFDTSHGVLVFKNAKGEEVAVDDVIYKATYNYKLISNDGSYGIHNPLYTIQLLQQSYKELTGKNVPNAQLR